MSDKVSKERESIPFSRREFLAASGVGIAVASGTYSASAADGSAASNAGQRTVAPFDSLRDYVQALEENGLLMRFGRIDQDAYEGTALMYRMVDHYGRFHAPVVLFDEVRIDGQWIKGPVIANHARHVDLEAITFGLRPVPGDAPSTFQRARTHLDQMLKESGGAYPAIPPVLISGENAPCKEVILEGDDIDIRRFPFFRNNPGDSGRFINTASVFTTDPEMGLNIGTYRCEIKGAQHIAVGSGEGQSGYNMLMAAKARGEKTANIALVVGQDPMIWLVSGARIPERRGKKPIDELAAAGGLRGKAIEVVRCETNDLKVPAHAEMIIEGVISLESFERNGPYGEGTGYIGAPYETAFPMTVTRLTHRKDPWIVNDFTGVTRALLEMPGAALTTAGLKLFMPEITDYRYVDSVTFISVKKDKPGQALEIGKRLAKMIPVFKIVMMVDDDVDLWNPADLFLAFATRWQAYPASHVFEDLPTMPLEASSPIRERTSKIVIDATRQLPEEGGPEAFPEYSRHVLMRHDPTIFDRIDAKWADVIARGPAV
jgi:4-hydroxy-3-polyprenylbenzoate decarboxylase